MSVADIQNAIRQQSEDLRDELSDLAKWEAEMKQKQGKSTKTIDTDLPPVRGTAPLKPAGKAAAKREDPLQVCKEQGNEYFRRSNFSEALRMYTKGIDTDPHSSTTHVLYANRAMCHLKLSQWEMAEKDATICVQMNRTYGKGFFRRAVARKNLKKWKDARSDLETVLVLNPGDDEVQDEIAYVTEQLRKTQSETAAPAATKRKKLVIEEVEDDDEEEQESAADDSPSTAAATERAALERKRVEEENAQKEQARQREIQAEEAARRRSNKNNSRVEIVEEVEDEEPEVKPAPPVKKTAPAPAQSEKSPVKKESSASPNEKKERKERSLNISRWTKENLKQPKSFAEFEKVYLEIKTDSELLEFYLLQIPFGSYKSLFGSSVSSEMIVDFVKVASKNAENRLSIMQNLGQVSRLEEIVMFFSASETAVVSSVLKQLESDGHNVAKLKLQWC